MVQNKTIKTLFSLTPTIAVLVGCSLSDQYLSIDPQLTVVESSVGESHTVQIAVADNRPTPKLGEIKDVRKNIYNIELQEGSFKTIQENISAGLKKQGFAIGQSDTKMDVAIEKLSLSSRKYPLTFKTDLEAVISVHISNKNQVYNNRLRIVTTKETAGPPFSNDSRELVNEALSKHLNDMISSDKLIRTLSL